MRRLPALTCMLLAATAWARAWNGIDPGTSTRDDVTKRFGEPTKVVTTDGKEVLAYLGPGAIKGTQQTQFKVNPTTRVVERIDVFPGPVIDRDAIENTYGHVCAPAQAGTNPCYVKKVDERFRTYFQYVKLGLTIFFNDDGKTVESFVFTSPKKEAVPPSGPAH